MKKHLTRFGSLFLALLMIITSSVVAYASEPTQLNEQNTVVDFPNGREIYNGKTHCPDVKVAYVDGETKTELQKDKDFTVVYPETATNAGQYSLKIQFTGDYAGEIEKAYTVNKADGFAVSDVRFDGKAHSNYLSYAYTGSAIKPNVTVYSADLGSYLVNGKDYTVSYSNNLNVGKGQVTVRFQGNYLGSYGKEFDIKKASASKYSVALSKTSFVYNGKTQKPSVTVKNSKGKVLKNGRDYTVSVPKAKNIGKYTAKVTFKGNYSGSISKSFAIVPKGTAIKKVSASMQGFGVEWKKQTKKTTGYQVKYSTDKAFKKNVKTVTVKGNKNVKKSFSKLGNYNTYYVRARVYSTVKQNGKNVNLYSGWCQAKSVKTKGVPAVKLNSVKSGEYAFTANYNRNSGVTGYQVQYSTASNFKGAKTISKKNTKTKAKSYTTTVSKLSGAKKYYVRVRTYKTVKVGKKKVTYYSNWSTVKTVTTKKVTPAAAPTGFKLSAPKYKKLKMTWNATKGASGYQVQYSWNDSYYDQKVTKAQVIEGLNWGVANYDPNDNDNTYGLYDTKSNSFVKEKLKANKHYVARVRSYRTVNGKRVYSAWTDIQMVKVLEDTSESLTAAQKQWVVDNALKPTNEVAKKYGYKKTVTVRKIDAGTHEYDVAVKYYAFSTLSSNPKSNYYYKDFKNSWFEYAEDHESLMDLMVTDYGRTRISYCWIDRGGYSDLCLVCD